MISIHDLSMRSGVSTRMLRYYDKQDVLKPIEYAADGRRFYADDALSRLQQILAFQSLGYSIHQIKELFSHSNSLPDLLDKQIDLLTQEQRRIDITFAEPNPQIQIFGLNEVVHDAFHRSFIFDQTQIPAGQALSLLTNQPYTIRDIAIQEADIEEVIRNLYNEKGGDPA